MNVTKEICLLCLENNDNLLEIYGKQGIYLNIANILQQHFWFEVDTFAAKNICENCWKNVESFHSFYNFVKSIHQQTLETKATIDNGLVGSSIEEKPIDTKDVSDIFTDITDTFDPPTPTKDDLEVESNINSDQQPPAIAEHKTRKYKRKRPGSPPAKRYKTDAHTSLLSQYFNMACDLCDTLLSSYRDTKKHYKDVHNRQGYLICCNVKYDRLQHMLSHCEWHINPSAFKCEKCPLTFREKYSLRRHVKELHAPEIEKIIKCNYCDEKFSRQSFLNKHLRHRHAQSFRCPICQKLFTGKVSMRYHIRDNHSPEEEREYRRNMKRLKKGDQVKEEDKPFVCDICGSRFVLLSNIRSHMRVHVHRNFGRKADMHSHICEICAKPFKTRAKREEHYINIHMNKEENKVDEKVQCDICGKWLKHKYTLTAHMFLHNSKPVACKICGHVYSNERTMEHHIKRVHRDPWLECVVCGKKFKCKVLLKEHMAIHAGITDLYTCTFCPKTFRSNANMYSHRKRAHPAELEKMREK